MNARPTPHLANLRDLGGLRSAGGRRLRGGLLLRSDAPHPGDLIPSSVAWPPSLVLDLRSATSRHVGHPLEADGTRVVWFPMAADADPSAALLRGAAFDIAVLYQRILSELGTHIATIFELILGADGPTLVHCVAGKDRTGVLVAVLLAAAEVARAEIVTDYHATSPNMAAVMERMVETVAPAKRSKFRRRLAEAPPGLFSTPSEGIAAVLDELDSHRGGPIGWLRERGVDQRQIDSFRARILIAGA
ncbi:tyrosine-protein phosphatase [Mycolicibacterium pulveris]|uniref:Tyrosine specific protein phosphatases domain-containing protein n=1 Tax=Mycolicibacterium pulveris TaxID=36813 RepID=A0A7I7UQ08_MYCPV|nr:tyrosine-protein phosphatase [Mycolicibacterium pulveris]MCV6983229.1 tyrosine-protein phosphatase [Mycolicibacterium pulveris]BBY83100.1 hypothetical protein MPUL_42580 [Mycolicibacterium pulveris]